MQNTIFPNASLDPFAAAEDPFATSEDPVAIAIDPFAEDPFAEDGLPEESINLTENAVTKLPENPFEPIAFDSTTMDLDKQFNKKVHLRIQKRNARKSITTIEGFDQYQQIDPKKFLKYLRKNFHCSGAIKKSTKGIAIVVQGDHRADISDFLQQKYKVNKKDIITHGF